MLQSLARIIAQSETLMYLLDSKVVVVGGGGGAGGDELAAG